MKKIVSVALAAALAMSMVACGGSKAPASSSQAASSVAASSVAASSAAAK